MKRILALLLCLALVAVMYPISATATTQQEQQRISRQISDIYWKTISSTGMDSLHGYCGTMAGWELYYMGITEYPVTQNGNEMYDILQDGQKLCQGITPHCYPVSQYTITEALNTITGCGSRNAYDIMVGFQWTNTAAGSLYGHVAVIHGIIDGMVYFSEGFATPFQADPSQAMVCTIEEFGQFYDSWASFEGLIHFVDQRNVPGCESYASNVFVKALEGANLTDSPHPEQAQLYRQALPGERLYADALCRNEEGQLYYRVIEDGKDLYVAAALTEPVWFSDDGITVTDCALPGQINQGEDILLSGVIRSARSRIRGICVEVTDSQGRAVGGCELERDSFMVDLSADSVNTPVDISSLPQGAYTYSVYCDLTNYYSAAGELVENMQRLCVIRQNIVIGQGEEVSSEVESVHARQLSKNGWKYESGSWYYYENGVCRTGWFCYDGVDYYLQEDGAAAIGWHTINGKPRYFTQTGAMRIGWLETQEGVYYMLSNGEAAVGTLLIEGEQYTFSNLGLLITQ